MFHIIIAFLDVELQGFLFYCVCFIFKNSEDFPSHSANISLEKQAKVNICCDS